MSSGLARVVMLRLERLARVAWAAPWSAIGLLLGGLVVLLGGTVRKVDGTLEFAYRQRAAQCGAYAKTLSYRAITLGHVILAVTEDELGGCRQHERVHVEQYERWGPFFVVAYFASGAWQLLKGRSAYWDNPFEVQARKSGDGVPSPASNARSTESRVTRV